MKGTTIILTGAILALGLLLAPTCCDDDPNPFQRRDRTQRERSTPLARQASNETPAE